jgi:hypothetical protein
MDNVKRAQVIMLPTITGILYKSPKNNSKCNGLLQKTSNFDKEHFIRVDGFNKAQHLYIISDDKIKEGDWCISIDKNSKLHKTFKCISKQSFINPEFLNSIDAKDIKKIIATTDTSLFTKIQVNIKHTDSINFYLPQPSQQFIEKYIESYNKGEVITDVLVEYEILYDIELLIDTNDFPKGSLIRGKCANTTDFSKSKRRFLELYTDGNYLAQADATNTIKELNKNYFKTVEFIQLKVNPKDKTITIKKLKDSWDREELKSLFKKHEQDVIKYINSSGPTSTPSFNDKWIKENL